MKVIHGSENYGNSAPLVITIGNFDGVHIGHRYIIKKTITAAREMKGRAAAMVFDPHPRSFFNRERPQLLITTLEQRIALLEELGIEYLIVQPFNEDFARLSAEQFVTRILKEHLSAKKVIVSSKFRFGNKATGSIDTLKKLSKENGFEVETVENVYFRHTVVSSSFIRNAIVDGEMEIVRRMLDRPYTLEGEVYPDTQRGTNLFNIPTSNIKPENDLVPALGIYASVVELEGIRYPAATYIGTRPTFSGRDVVIETHIIGFSGELYGKHICVELLKKTRPDKKFGHLTDLLQQIKDDINECLDYLKRHEGDEHIGTLKWSGTKDA